MSFSKSKLAILLIILDWLVAFAAWASFYYVRKVYIEETGFSVGSSYYPGLAIVPIFWLIIFALQGTYIDVRRLHRMKVVGLTFFGSLFGTVVLFFFLLLDDEVDDHLLLYKKLFWL